MRRVPFGFLFLVALTTSSIKRSSCANIRTDEVSDESAFFVADP